MFLLGVCNKFESSVLVKLFESSVVTLEVSFSDVFCIVRVLEGSCKFCNSVVSSCRSSVKSSYCIGCKLWSVSVYSSGLRCKIFWLDSLNEVTEVIFGVV